MNPKLQSLIRHALTALGTVLLLTGSNKLTGLINYLTDNLDGLYSAIGTIIGAVSMILGYFKNSDRFKTN